MLIKSVEISDVVLGDYSPLVIQLRISKSITPDLAFSTDADVHYKGGAHLKLKVILANTTTVPIQLIVSEFSGTVRVRIPHEDYKDMLSVAFIRDPGINFKVDSPITLKGNETIRQMINNSLSAIIRRVFLDMWVIPSSRKFYLPLLEPMNKVSSFLI